MKKLNKKGLLFNISLVIITIIVLTTALIALGQLTSFREGIGARAFEIVQLYQEAEKRLFYVDQSAKLSAQQAAYDLAQKGGFFNETLCVLYRDFAVWATADPSISCYPINYKEDFKRILNNNMKNYLSPLPSDMFIEMNGRFSVYPYNLSRDINYELSFIDEKLVGIAYRPMQINFYRGERSIRPIIGEYKINPSFNIDFDYDIEGYDRLEQQAVELIRECNNETISCVDNKASEYNWSVGVCGSPSERVFTKFIDEYLDCIESPDTDCYCEIEYLSSLERNNGEDYEILLERQDVRTKITLVPRGLEKTIDSRMPNWLETYGQQGSTYDDISYHIHYTDQDEFELSELEPGAVNWDVPQGAPYSGKARIYKAANGLLSFIDTDEYGSEGFRDLSECSVIQTNLSKFCFESDVIVFVNDIKDEVGYAPVTYKFALYVPVRQEMQQE
jgi:hypothetical protein